MTPATIAPTWLEAPPEADEGEAETGGAVTGPLAIFVEEGRERLVVTHGGRLV